MTRIGCTGVFDYIIHKGHLSFLNEVRSYGNEVIVFLSSDNYIISKKKRLPFYGQNERERNLTTFVDRVICLRGNTFTRFYIILSSRLDVFAFGDDQIGLWFYILKFLLRLIGVKCVKEIGSRIESTTNLLLQDGKLKELQL